MKILTITDLFINKEVVEVALRKKLGHIDQLVIENFAVDSQIPSRNSRTESKYSADESPAYKLKLVSPAETACLL